MNIVGIDEVGRGPLAGPVTVGIVCCESKIYQKLKRDASLPPLGKDSKKLKPKDREKFEKVLKKLSKLEQLSYSVVHIGNKTIDSKGLSFSIKKAIEKGIFNLKINSKSCQVLLDGGLHAPENFKKQKTIIKGDEKERIIAWASILAKVSRDALMTRMSKKYPKYGFEFHKGYGTVKHLQTIQVHGLSRIHRASFNSG